MRSRALLFAIPALLLAPFGCVSLLGDDFTVNGERAQLPDGATPSDGSGGGNDGANNPDGPAPPTDGQTQDTGVGPYTCDKWELAKPRLIATTMGLPNPTFERLYMFRISPKYVRILTRGGAQNVSFTTYTFDPGSGGTTMDVHDFGNPAGGPSPRMMDAERIGGGVGVLELDDVAGVNHLQVTPIPDTYTGGSFTPQPVPLNKDGSLLNPQTARFIETAPNAYFYMATTVDPLVNMPTLVMGSSRNQTSPYVLTTGNDAYVNMNVSPFVHNDKFVYVFASTDGPSNIAPTEYQATDDATQLVTRRTFPVAQQQVVPLASGTSPTGGWDLTFGVLGPTQIRLQIGLVGVADLMTFDPTTFGHAKTYASQDITRVPANKGSSRWADDQLALVGGSADLPGVQDAGPGLNFLWLDKDAVVHAEVYGPTKLLNDHALPITSTAVDFAQRVIGLVQSFDVAWIEHVNNDPTYPNGYDNLYYNTLDCHP